MTVLGAPDDVTPEEADAAGECPDSYPAVESAGCNQWLCTNIADDPVVRNVAY